MFLKSKLLLRIGLVIYSLPCTDTDHTRAEKYQSRVLLEWDRISGRIQYRLKVFSILRHMTYHGQLKVFSELRRTLRFVWHSAPHVPILIQSFKMSNFRKIKKGRGRFCMSANLKWFRVCFLSSGDQYTSFVTPQA